MMPCRVSRRDLSSNSSVIMPMRRFPTCSATVFRKLHRSRIHRSWVRTWKTASSSWPRPRMQSLAPWHSRTMRKKKPLPPSTVKCYAPHVSDSLRPSMTASSRNTFPTLRTAMRRRTRCRTRAMSTSVCVISSTEMPCRVSTWSIR